MTADAMLVPKGTRLGAFELDEYIDVGGMGSVWRAHHVHTRLPVAVKIASGASDTADILQFRREVEAVASLDHPNVVRVFDHGVIERGWPGVDDNTPYLVMEYASRGTLHDLRRPIEWYDVECIATSILSGLAHAHARGVVHRDLKPGNILLGSSKDPRPDLKLADFGIAYAVGSHAPYLSDASPHGETEDALGTPAYMAPEQFMGLWRDYGPWTDLYAVGVLIWELCCEETPFTARNAYGLGLKHIADPLPAFEPTITVPDGIEQWLHTLLAKDPQHRFQWATDALSQLHGLSSTTPSPRRAQYQPAFDEASAARILQGSGLGTFSLRPARTVGRDDADRRIDGAMARAACGLGPSLTIIRGPSGSGTSHLAGSAVRRTAERGLASWMRVDARFGWGSCSILRSIVERFRCVGLAAEELQLRILEISQTLDVDLRSIDVVVRAIRALGAGATDGPEQDEIREAVAELLAALAAERPLAIWIDDLDAAPAVSALIDHLMDQYPQARIGFLCATSCPHGAADHVDRLTRRTDAEEILLSPLGASDIEALIQSMLPLAPPLVKRLADHSGGYPGRARALLLEWVNGDLLQPGDGGFCLRDGAVTTSGGESARSREHDTEQWHWIAPEQDATTASTIKVIRPEKRVPTHAPETPVKSDSTQRTGGRVGAPATILFAGQ